jgi:hypothetical protein
MLAETEKPVFERMKQEILEDIADGTVPATVASYSELHDYVDANGYGGAFEDWSWEDGKVPEEVVNFWNRLQEACDQWLKNGRDS